MAATKPGLGFAAITLAALALPGMTPKVSKAEILDEFSGDFQFSHYQEDQKRVQADQYHFATQGVLDQSLRFSTDVLVDHWTGASPVLSVPESTPIVMTGATQMAIKSNNAPITNPNPVQIMSAASTHETRIQQDFRLGGNVGEVPVNIAGGYSNEPDWISNFGSIGTSVDLNDKMTTLFVNTGFTSNQIDPVTRPTVHKTSESTNLMIGGTQVIDKKSLISTSFSYTNSTGYLAAPYKKVFIQNYGVIYDQRPNQRSLFAWSLDYIRHITNWDSALHLSYRLFADNWGVHSSTMEVALLQPIFDGWSFEPRCRYYTQSSAYFYAPYFIGFNSESNYSSDYRLSSFGALAVGFNVNKSIHENIQINTSYEYYTHAASLKLGGNTLTSFSDFSFYMVSGNIQIKF